MVVAFVGSSHHKPSSPAYVAAGAVLSALPAGATPATTGGFLGLDLFVRYWCGFNNVRFAAFRQIEQSVSAHRAGVVRMVRLSDVVVVFPGSVNPLSGSWLAVFAAVQAKIPVFVFMSGVLVSAYPCCLGCVGWQAAELPFPVVGGFSFAVPVVQAQTSLFGGSHA